MEPSSERFLRLALQWQGHNDAVMLTGFHQSYSGSLFLESICGCFPASLVIVKAWEDVSRDLPVEIRSTLFKQSTHGEWFHRTEALVTWLQEKQDLSREQRKAYGLLPLPWPSILWRPFSPSKADRREDEQWPKWAKSALRVALFLVGSSDVPLTTPEVAEQCKHVYTERTVRNALDELRRMGWAAATGCQGQQRSWTLTSKGLAGYNRLNQWGLTMD